MNALMLQDTPAPQTSDVKELARTLGKVFTEYVDYQKRRNGLSGEQALAKAEEGDPEGALQVMDSPSDQVDWFALEALAREDPELAVLKWESMKQEAREELTTGSRAAQTLEKNGAAAWNRAQFLALRDELIQAWQPHNGIERQLVDQMAQAQASSFFWLERLMLRASCEPLNERTSLETRGKWEPPRVSAAQAMEQAGVMVDRFNKIFLRTLRALRDLRRYSPQVIVQNAEQVNVAQQQVNVKEDPPSAPSVPYVVND